MNTVPRAIAALTGILVLALVAMFTFGLAIIAPIGMLVAGLVARRRHVGLTRGASWLGASLGVMVTLVLGAGFVAARAPAGTLTQLQQNFDSISTASQTKPPPTWVERLVPGAARARANATSSNVKPPRAFMIWVTVVGGFFVCVMISSFVGTLGWCAGLLLAYAALGRWLPGESVATDQMAEAAPG